jgi:tRNA U38,U39,U40 pseudouridine synthase TruA
MLSVSRTTIFSDSFLWSHLIEKTPMKIISSMIVRRCHKWSERWTARIQAASKLYYYVL